jgi:K+-sensing histidine kinase KdpD
MGLGLTLARHIVRAHGGDISIDSEPGHGSTFVFTLPIPAEEELRGRAPMNGQPTLSDHLMQPARMEQ